MTPLNRWVHYTQTELQSVRADLLHAIVKKNWQFYAYSSPNLTPYKHRFVSWPSNKPLNR